MFRAEVWSQAGHLQRHGSPRVKKTVSRESYLLAFLYSRTGSDSKPGQPKKCNKRTFIRQFVCSQQGILTTPRSLLQKRPAQKKYRSDRILIPIPGRYPTATSCSAWMRALWQNGYVQDWVVRPRQKSQYYTRTPRVIGSFKLCRIQHFRRNTNPDLDPDPGFLMTKNWKKLQLKKSWYFKIQNCNLLFPRPPQRKSKLQKKPFCLRRKYPALQNVGFPSGILSPNRDDF
jgi:hypothetical protein